MGIVQKAGSDHIFKEPALCLFAQDVKVFADLQADEGFIIIVEPGIQGIESVDQALGIGSEIRLSIAEFIVVDPGLQGAGTDALVRDLFQSIADDPDELVLSGGIRIFGYNRIAGLADPGFKHGVYIFAETAVAQGLPDRRPLRVAEGVVEDLEGHVGARVQAVRQNRQVPGQEGLARRILLSQDRVGAARLHRL